MSRFSQLWYNSSSSSNKLSINRKENVNINTTAVLPLELQKLIYIFVIFFDSQEKDAEDSDDKNIHTLNVDCRH